MTGFSIQTQDGPLIRFRFYHDSASCTSEAFWNSLPFSRVLFHARVSGQEIWTDDAPKLDIPQENSSVFADPGEIAIGPVKPQRNKVAGMMGIFYGEGKLVDGSNIFAKIFDEDLPLLKELGDKIWRQGAGELKFEKI
ncbi:MAG: DUF3830 family protein [Bacteroidota bacterium]|nr:DUF3830 family protein [Bacteroidota bacterium]